MDKFHLCSSVSHLLAFTLGPSFIYPGIFFHIVDKKHKEGCRLLFVHPMFCIHISFLCEHHISITSVFHVKIQPVYLNLFYCYAWFGLF